MIASSLKRFLPHLFVIVGFIVIALVYFNPVLSGKKIFQSDIMHYNGMAQQQREFAKVNKEETYWTNSAFSGMPTFQLGAKYPHNYIKKIDRMLRFLPRPADYLFLYLLGFYILLLALRVNFKLAALGALAFGFSTYLIIILGVGHNAKAHAIAYMPLVMAGIVLTFQKKYILGFLLTTVALGLELVANHYQMTYYLLLLVIVLGIAYLVDAFKNKTISNYFKAIALLSVAALIAVGLNATNIMATKSYAKFSTRGQSELTIQPNGSPKTAQSGLSKFYITEYSYGLTESFNLFIPKFMGGGNGEDVGKDSETYKTYSDLSGDPIAALEVSRAAPMYWGNQPIVEAPAYVGAVVVFLFVLGLFLVKGRIKWWLVGGVIVSWILSLGKNWPFVTNPEPDSNPITNFFIDYVPLYDKFRAVSSIQVILELCIPILGVCALVQLFNKNMNAKKKLDALKYTVIITAGLCLIFLVFKESLFDFASLRDKGIPQPLLDAFIIDRKALFTTDTIRSLVFVLLSGGVIYMYLKEKLAKNNVIIVFTILILFDLVSIARQYVNNDNFVSARNVDKPYVANAADKEILKDEGHFRVFDMTREGQRAPARAAYFHNSLLGYHAAKLGRYDDVLNFYIYNNNENVINMLNTKYFIVEQEGTIFPYQNTEAVGNAWFVSEIEKVASANEEIKALDSLNVRDKAVTTMEISTQKNKNSFVVDTSAKVELQTFKPNYLKYESNNTNDGFAVFSEIYYEDGWNAYLNKKLVPHHRVNYILRGLEIPKGRHTIEFKFEPKVVETGSYITLISSVVLMLLLVGGLFFGYKQLQHNIKE